MSSENPKDQLFPRLGIVKYVGIGHAYIKEITGANIFDLTTEPGDLYFSGDVGLEKQQIVLLQKIKKFENQNLPTVLKLKKEIPICFADPLDKGAKIFVTSKWYHYKITSDLEIKEQIGFGLGILFVDYKNIVVESFIENELNKKEIYQIGLGVTAVLDNTNYSEVTIVNIWRELSGKRLTEFQKGVYDGTKTNPGKYFNLIQTLLERELLSSASIFEKRLIEQYSEIFNLISFLDNGSIEKVSSFYQEAPEFFFHLNEKNKQKSISLLISQNEHLESALSNIWTFVCTLQGDVIRNNHLELIKLLPDVRFYAESTGDEEDDVILLNHQLTADRVFKHTYSRIDFIQERGLIWVDEKGDCFLPNVECTVEVTQEINHRNIFFIAPILKVDFTNGRSKFIIEVEDLELLSISNLNFDNIEFLKEDTDFLKIFIDFLFEEAISTEKNILSLKRVSLLKKWLEENSFLNKELAEKISSKKQDFIKQLSLTELIENNLFQSLSELDVKKLLKVEIAFSQLVFIDLESDGKSIHELAFFNSDFKLSRNCKSKNEGQIEEGLKTLAEFLTESKPVIVGQNIEEFDLPILIKHSLEVSELEVWDTLKIESVLNPFSESLALETSHNALDDAQRTKELFFDQCLRILFDGNIEQYQYLLPKSIFNSLVRISKRLPEEYEINGDSFFIKRNQPDYIIHLKEKVVDTKFQLIAPLQFHRNLLIPELNLHFQNSYKKQVDFNKCKACFVENSLISLAMERFELLCSSKNISPIFERISPWLRRRIESKVSDLNNILIERTDNFDFSRNGCWTPYEFLNNFENINQEHKVFILYPEIAQHESKYYVGSIDKEKFKNYLIDRNWWKKISGGRSFFNVDISEVNEFLPEVKLPKFINNYWIEKDSFESLEVFGNCSDYLQELESLPIDVERLTRSESNSINGYNVSSNSKPYQLMRLNSDTRYRDEYWLNNILLIEKIIYDTNSSILFVENESERHKLIDYYKSLKFYIPSTSASLNRQLELLNQSKSKRAIIVANIRNFNLVLENSRDQKLNLIFETLPIKEQWVANRELLISSVEGNIIEDAENINEARSRSGYNPIEATRYLKPFIDYLKELAGGFNSDHLLFFLEVRLEGLEKLMGLKKKAVQLEITKSLYDERRQQLREYIPPAEILFDESSYNQALDAIKKVFLDTGHDFYPYQKDYLPTILSGQKDMVVSIPTGGGKSILFQGPSMYKSSQTYQLNLVVTPLKALMSDQVEGLWQKDFWGSVEAVSSDLEYLEIKDIFRRLAGGEILMLYITPERFRSQPFIRALEKRISLDRRLGYVTFDEAHCVSQWGNEFRPDYRYAARFLSRMREKTDYTLLMLSATISEQVYEDLKHIFPNLFRKEGQHVFNPIREHINLGFERAEKDSRLNLISNVLESEFDQEKSRALVFVNSRKKCEELAEAFNGLSTRFTNIGAGSFYHAGMSYEDRNTAYSKFKSGGVHTLFATKAFGMGMDIPNIHYIFHFKPSSSFEDFLQEVGRAGRNAKALQEAGFSGGNPLKTYCYFDSTDFRKMKEFLLENSLTWIQLNEVFGFLNEYFEKISLPKDSTSPVPFNLLTKSPMANGRIKEDKLVHLFRLSLYWLEKLNRIRLGFYSPSVIYFSTNFPLEPDGNDIHLKKLRKFLMSNMQARTEAKSQVVLVSDLLKIVEKNNFNQLLKLLLKGHQGQYFQLDWYHRLIPVKKEDLKRKDEIKFLHENPNGVSPNLEAAIELALSIVESVKPKKSKTFNRNDIKEMITQNVEFLFTEINSNIFTQDRTVLQKNYKNFQSQRVKHVFKLVGKLKGLKYKSIIEEENVFQYFLNVDATYKRANEFLINFKSDCYRIIRFVMDEEMGDNEFHIQKLFQAIESDDLEYLEGVLIFLKNMGYIRIPNSLIPIGIEITRLSDERINEKNSEDGYVYKEFLENSKLRELRLVVLEAAALLHQDRDDSTEVLDSFIKEYFECKDSGDIINLLNEYISHFPDGKSLLNIIKEEALKEKEEEMNSGQREIYDFPVTQNLNVVAGPGSGKTYTLVLRVARMIHRKGISPESILVLAYNRAVVAELKNRLSSLMHQLGYDSIAKRIKIFTFHGFMKYILRDKLVDVKFEDWTSTFLREHRNSPRNIDLILSPIQFVLIDEFQDITPDRIEILKIIADPARTKLTVIGDKNQSIYGYERVKQGGSIHPEDSYKDFDKIYNPEVRSLMVNYRSLPAISNLANNVLPDLEESELFENFRSDEFQEGDYAEILNGHEQRWLTILQGIINETNIDEERHRQIAIMFRSNEEVFRAYSKILSGIEIPSNTQLSIQSGAVSFMRVQEVHEFFSQNKNRFEEKVSDSLIQIIDNCHEDYIARNWDVSKVHLLDALSMEFMKNAEPEATLQDFHDFTEEITRRDDGQLSKIFQLHLRALREKYPNIKRHQIILTTIHKVKGLEYSAVLIPPSFSDFPFMPDTTAMNQGIVTLEDYAAEERRLYYVALTRAEDRLIWLQADREEQFLNNNSYRLPEHHRMQLGYPIKEGIDKFYISYGASRPENFDSYIQQNVKVGDSVLLSKNQYGGWLVSFNGTTVAKLRGNFLNNIPERISAISGLTVTSLHRYTWQDCLDYDEKNGTNFQQNWNQSSRNRGFVTLPDFTGFGMMS